MKYVHNIVIYDDHTGWFDCSAISCQLCNCYKNLGELQENGINAVYIYGYIVLELESPYEDCEGGDLRSAYILCKTEEDLNEAYNRCCDAIINHPKVIDLRGLDAKLVEEY